MKPFVTIIGGGLAGPEAAWHVARAGVDVRLYEMRPTKETPVHRTGMLSELVCSNSLKSNLLTNAAGLLEEMRILGSVTMECAEENRVPAGEALAVDRERFAECVTARVTSLPNVTLLHEEVTEIPSDGVTIIASGPLTSDALAKHVAGLTGSEYLYFYDAVAPTITADSIDYDRVFRASRYGKGEPAYLNCPFTEAEYDAFWEALVSAECAPVAEFEKLKFFEGCMPVEELASRGRQTLSFGPMKPVGLDDPRTGRWPHAVVQLRQENAEGTLYGLVGFQTRLKWGEQERVFRMIPGLERAEFVRFGVMHRNTYIESPKLLLPTLQMRDHGSIFFAGQITGVEGYVESAAMGILAGINAARLIKGEELLIFPKETMTGCLADYISSPQTNNFQPMNANFGVLPKPESKIRNKRTRYKAQSDRALRAISDCGLRIWNQSTRLPRLTCPTNLKSEIRNRVHSMSSVQPSSSGGLGSYADSGTPGVGGSKFPGLVRLFGGSPPWAGSLQQSPCRNCSPPTSLPMSGRLQSEAYPFPPLHRSASLRFLLTHASHILPPDSRLPFAARGLRHTSNLPASS